MPRFFIALLLTGYHSAVVTQTIKVIDNFDPSYSTPQPPWEVIVFNDSIPPTQYQIVSWDGVDAVVAEANKSMALLASPLEINLEETPVLCWRWRIDNVIESADMMRKAGDDYAARVYVSFKLPEASLDIRTQIKLKLARSIYGSHVPDAAINYVWDNRHPVETQVPNAYTDRTQMLVVRSGNRDAGRWVEERRNVLSDFNSIFGVEGAMAIQLAIASDTDNTGETARAGFSDLHFVGKDQPCHYSSISSDQ